MLFKILVIVIILAIMWSLGSGLFYLVRERDAKDSARVAKALTWRIGLSLFLFLLLFLAFALGWIKPHGV